MERQLSAAQRDKIFMDEVKEERNLQRELIDVLKGGNEGFTAGVASFGQNFLAGCAMMANAVAAASQQPSTSTNPGYPSRSAPQPRVPVATEAAPAPQTTESFTDMIYTDIE